MTTSFLPATNLAFLQNIGLPELIVIMVVLLLLFGRRLPEVGKSIGKGIVEFKKGLNEAGTTGTEQPTPAVNAHQTAPNPYAPPYTQPYPPAIPAGAGWSQQQPSALPAGAAPGVVPAPYAGQPGYAPPAGAPPASGYAPASPYPGPYPYPPQGYAPAPDRGGHPAG
jgi:sec-independent protein translocase protein TatA